MPPGGGRRAAARRFLASLSLLVLPFGAESEDKCHEVDKAAFALPKARGAFIQTWARGTEGVGDSAGRQKAEARSPSRSVEARVLSGTLALATPSTAAGEALGAATARDFTWTTNIEQAYSACPGSLFEVDKSGNVDGMVMHKGIHMKKAKCPAQGSQGSVPSITKSIMCDNKSTGCHMWCAPVWVSYKDMKDWGAMDERCKGWNGTRHNHDPECPRASRIFAWARTEVPAEAQRVNLAFAITQPCTRWCSPLWVTVYDTKNFAKFWRWCFNRKGEFGECDKEENVASDTWHDRSFELFRFASKHGYHTDLTLEFAMYGEFEAVETLVNKMAFDTTPEIKTTAPPDAELNRSETKDCGNIAECPKNLKCCRDPYNAAKATCCPTTFKCCADECCPSYYKCEVKDGVANCALPDDDDGPKRPAVCTTV